MCIRDRYVPDAIASVAHLAACCDENGQVVGFIGVDGAMIEMLFIHPSLRGCGLGLSLIHICPNTRQGFSPLTPLPSGGILP